MDNFAIYILLAVAAVLALVFGAVYFLQGRENQ